MFVFFGLSSFVFTNGLQQNYVNFENKYLIKPIPYNSLVDRIEKHEISKIYFSPRYESVISEEAGKVGDNLEDYSVTTISPFLTTDLVGLSVKNNVEPVFSIIQQPNQIQIVAGDILSFLNASFVPFILLTVFISFFRSPQSSNSPMNNMFTRVGEIDIKNDKENMKNANITLKSFAGSEEIFEECTEVVSYIDRNPFLGRSLSSGDKYSEKTKEIIDSESLELVRNAYDEAKRILSENRQKMDLVIEELLEKNILCTSEFNNLLNND